MFPTIIQYSVVEFIFLVCMKNVYSLQLCWLVKRFNKRFDKKSRNKYDVYIILNGTKEYQYARDGEERSGVQFRFAMKFSKRTKK